MEYVHGRNLEDYARDEPVTPRRAAELVAKLAGALAMVHRRGIIHRDIKPRNILIDEIGRAPPDRLRPGPAAARLVEPVRLHLGRHARLHGPRAGPARARPDRPAERRLRIGRGALLPADRPGAVRGQDPGRGLGPRPALRLRGRRPADRQGPAAAGADLPEGHGRRPGRSVCHGRGIRAGAGGVPRPTPAGGDRGRTPPGSRALVCDLSASTGAADVQPSRSSTSDAASAFRFTPRRGHLRTHPAAAARRDHALGRRAGEQPPPGPAAAPAGRRAGQARRRGARRGPGQPARVSVPVLDRLRRQGRAALSLEGARLDRRPAARGQGRRDRAARGHRRDDAPSPSAPGLETLVLLAREDSPLPRDADATLERDLAGLQTTQLPDGMREPSGSRTARSSASTTRARATRSARARRRARATTPCCASASS